MGGFLSSRRVRNGLGPRVRQKADRSGSRGVFQSPRACLPSSSRLDPTVALALVTILRRVSVENWNALRAVGETANRRLCDAEARDARSAPDVVTFQRVTRPSTNEDGLHSPGHRFGDPRVTAVFSALVGFCFLLTGFTNRQLVERVSALLSTRYTARQATYDLRRLKRRGLIRRVSKANRYQLTPSVVASPFSSQRLMDVSSLRACFGGPSPS